MEFLLSYNTDDIYSRLLSWMAFLPLSVEEDGVWLPDLGKELPVESQLPHACCVVPVAEIMKIIGSREDQG